MADPKNRREIARGEGFASHHGLTFVRLCAVLVPEFYRRWAAPEPDDAPASSGTPVLGGGLLFAASKEARRGPGRRTPSPRACGEPSATDQAGRSRFPPIRGRGPASCTASFP